MFLGLYVMPIFQGEFIKNTITIIVISLLHKHHHFVRIVDAACANKSHEQHRIQCVYTFICYCYYYYYYLHRRRVVVLITVITLKRVRFINTLQV